MPAFQLSQQSPADLLQLCGVKRKAESGAEMDYLCHRTNDEQHPGPKRICLCPEEEVFNSVGNEFLHNEHDQTEVSYAKSHSVVGLETNNDKTMTTDMQVMLQSGGAPRVGAAPSVAGVTWSQVMDSMEVDCNAEHQTPYQPTSSVQEVQAQIDSRFCDDYCGLGSVSPVSGLLRCYCRPSWEGMVEMQPYRSDYY